MGGLRLAGQCFETCRAIHRPHGAGRHQRSGAGGIAVRGVGTLGQQIVDDLQAVEHCRQHQCATTVSGGGIHRHAVFQQQADHREITLEGGAGYGQLAVGGQAVIEQAAEHCRVAAAGALENLLGEGCGFFCGHGGGLVIEHREPPGIWQWAQVSIRQQRQQKFASLFTAYQVATQPRPDGGVLLTLRASDGVVTRRVLSYAQLHSAEQLSWAISAIRRDLAEQASELPVISMLQSQQRFALPTYR
ncbi:hypothetical protein WR25_15529 [Diploscapter pachys]|uniref:Uncharacterized protein n=1 Tax=Diploscapter pachys TaxID=2018661 RepID=A0A2A2KK37_9BILA|nr:hypothetical protein WR25_15529 [Diploscapter pachys]